MPPLSHLDKTLTALAGEFSVAAQLCLRGYVASLTLKNYPDVDIFCLNPRNSRQSPIQVKSKYRGDGYFIPPNLDASSPPFVFVYINTDKSTDFYIVPASDVARLARQELAEYIQAHPGARTDQPLMVNLRSLRSFKDRWELLGLE